MKVSPLGVEEWQVGEWKGEEMEVGGVPSRRREVDQQKHGDGRNWGNAVNNPQSRQQLSLSVYVPIKSREKERSKNKTTKKSDVAREAGQLHLSNKPWKRGRQKVKPKMKLEIQMDGGFVMVYFIIDPN